MATADQDAEDAPSGSETHACAGSLRGGQAATLPKDAMPLAGNGRVGSGRRFRRAMRMAELAEMTEMAEMARLAGTQEWRGGEDGGRDGTAHGAARYPHAPPGGT